MGGVGVLIIFLVILWLLAFMTKRRFGILGLALTAGAYLSSLWSRDMVTLLDSLGLSFATLSTAGFVAIAIVLLPAFLLLFSGPSYKTTHARIVGATLFTILAVTLIAVPLERAIPLDGAGRFLFELIDRYSVYVITGGVILSLLDVLGIHAARSHNKKGKH
jgi:hypothetical protein